MIRPRRGQPERATETVEVTEGFYDTAPNEASDA
jgi:hypothetical protein